MKVCNKTKGFVREILIQPKQLFIFYMEIKCQNYYIYNAESTCRFYEIETTLLYMCN